MHGLPLGRGGFSTSDASSIESEASVLWNGARLLHPLAELGPKPAPAAAADADGIDDVLRLQPWLLE